MRDDRRGNMRNLLMTIGLLLAALVPSCAPAEEGGFQDTLGLRRKGAAAQSPVEFTATLVPDGNAGEVVLRISANIPPDHYIYSTTPAQGAETKIAVSRTDGLEVIGNVFAGDHEPDIVNDPVLEMTVEKYFTAVTWTRHFRLKPGAFPDRVLVAGQVKYQVCDKSTCRQEKYDFNAKLSEASAAVRSVVAKASVDSLIRFEQLVGPKGSQTVEGRWSVWITPRQVRPGSEVTVSVKAELNPGWHVFALDQRQLPDGSGPVPSVMGLTDLGDLIPLGASFVGPMPLETSSTVWSGLKERFHEGRVEWIRRYRVPDDAAAREISLAGNVAWGMCNSGGCQPPIGFQFRGKLIVADEELPEAAAFTVTATLRGSKAGNAIEELRLDANSMPNVVRDESRSAPDSPPDVAPTRRPVADEPIKAEKPLPFEVGVNPDKPAGGLDKSQGLPLFLVAAVVAGFAALLTPCVFPMIPITVSFFQKQSEKQHHRPITMATVYCLGIIGTFTGLGMLMSIVFSATAIQQLASNWFVNFFIAGVLIFFALNLLGMFEIQMPSWLLTYTAGQEGRGGFLGVLFMALTFTLTSFTCTFAFAGGLLAAAAQGDRLWPTLGLLAFSAAFSLPFFFLALFPSLLQKLPKSGGWMNVVKVVMGLIELGAAFKFFGNVDTTWNGQPAIFDFHLMISAWAVISIAAAMYLLGVFRLPHDVATDHIGVVRFIFAMSFLGFASYLGVGLFAADKPHGLVWRYVEAFANPNFEGGSDPSGPWLRHGDLKYALDFEKALDVAIAENKPLFLDFTGVTCTNCRYMEKGPMSKPDIEQRLSRFVRIQLFTDSVPIPDKKEAGRLLDMNVRLQEDWFGDVTLPSYVVIPPDRSALKDPSKIIETLKGKKEDAEFAQFLDGAWNKWQKVQAGRGGKVVSQR